MGEREDQFERVPLNEETVRACNSSPSKEWNTERKIEKDDEENFHVNIKVEPLQRSL